MRTASYLRKKLSASPLPASGLRSLGVCEIPPVTGNAEWIPYDALVLTGLANVRVVGYTEVGRKREYLSATRTYSRAIGGTTQKRQRWLVAQWACYTAGDAGIAPRRTLACPHLLVWTSLILIPN